MIYGETNHCKKKSISNTITLHDFFFPVPFSITMDYMNIVPRVRDPKVFVVPSKCTAQDVPEIAVVSEAHPPSSPA